MKIAMIVRRLDVKGGTQRQALSLANELRRRGHSVKLYAIFYSAERCYADLLTGFEVVALDPSESRAPEYPRLRRLPLGKYLETLLIVRHETRTARLLAFRIDRDIDLLNPHDRVAHRVAYFFKKHVRRVPSVWNTNDTHSMRWVVDKMADVDPKFQQPWWKRIVYRIRDWYENWRYIATQDAIVVVDQLNQRAVKKYFGREAIVVRNGPDLAHFSYRERTPPQGSVRLLTSGIFFPHRRFEDAIQAVKILRSWGVRAELDIIGDPAADPEYAEKLSRLIAELNVREHIHLLGRISEQELIRRYHANDIFLYPHHLQSDGLAPFEALATGMPVVVSRSAGAHEILTDGETGLLINPKDPAGIARAVKKMLDLPALYQKLSQTGASFVRANFSWQRYTDGILKVYQRVLGRG